MRKPMIGLVPLADVERESWWMLPGYMKGLEQAGAVPVMLPLTSGRELIGQLAETLDGFLFTGGQDVSPSVYGEASTEKCGQCCGERDEMEAELFCSVYERDKPIFGICRGIQLINVMLGGTLYQDLPTEHPSEVEHRQKPPYDIPCHGVRLLEGSPIRALLVKESILVNSCHHQGLKTLAPGLRVMGEAEDGVAEAVYAPGKRFVWAVQWHPEFSYLSDENSRKLFRAFVESCGERGFR